jgi:hypothetical protein
VRVCVQFVSMSVLFAQKKMSKTGYDADSIVNYETM